ncbi:hypothetical protein GCM10009851_22930 [Herbiconiux moechotypicola]|uniref:Uncharacterized protein n=1 Tax=Herbiconiux moechotypicola TaxID=637393 RepID=A0ABN3DQ69_9MICO
MPVLSSEMWSGFVLPEFPVLSDMSAPSKHSLASPAKLSVLYDQAEHRLPCAYDRAVSGRALAPSIPTVPRPYNGDDPNRRPA